jgi:hypothetical protein
MRAWFFAAVFALIPQINSQNAKYGPCLSQNGSNKTTSIKMTMLKRVIYGGIVI